jgi:selenocysteine-specific elongation factor
MATPIKSVVVGTAGHIDHGKTALIRALTGVDTDRLPEEKRRGITIDLGFASLDAIGIDNHPLRISFVDVPGHKHFIRNMLAGAGCVDAVLLVISAEEGIKPQTAEHLAICGLLGVQRGLVAVTKIDAVEQARIDKTISEVRSFLRGSFLAESPVLQVSARNGDGLEELRRELLSLAVEAAPSNPDSLLRLPLDRAFVMKGFGTVVTGTLLSGTLQAGQSLALEPGGQIVRVRGLQTHGRSEEYGHAGSRIALNLSGVDLAEVARGLMLVERDTLKAVTIIDVDTLLLPDASTLKHRSKVHFHAFTSETMVTVSLYESDRVEAGASMLMRLKLSQPIVLVPGDRFVLRQSSPASTIGGGSVLDAHPLTNARKDKSLTWLRILKNSSSEKQLLARIARRETAGISISALVSETGLTRVALLRQMKPLIESGHVRQIASDTLITESAINTASESVMRSLKIDIHNAGMKRSEARNQTGLSAEVFDFVVNMLVLEHRIEVRNELLHRAGDGSMIVNPDSESLFAIAQMFEVAALKTPAVAEVAGRMGITEVEMRRLMTLLLRDRTLVKMGSEEVYIHRASLDALRLQMRELRGQAIDVAQFKQLTGVSRKYAIPLLEYLDRERITRKDGDRRIVL